jgi:hypothetical protein
MKDKQGIVHLYKEIVRLALANDTANDTANDVVFTEQGQGRLSSPEGTLRATSRQGRTGHST